MDKGEATRVRISKGFKLDIILLSSLPPIYITCTHTPYACRGPVGEAECEAEGIFPPVSACSRQAVPGSVCVWMGVGVWVWLGRVVDKVDGIRHGLI